jgi:uncharacterized protein (AIM24 family)
MFCVNCGNQIRDDQNFCVSCGSPVKRAPATPPVTAAPPLSVPPPVTAPPSVTVPPPVTAPPQAAPTAHAAQPTEPALQSSGGKCSWCGGVIARGQTSCPRCGAALSMPEEISKSGWAQLPGRTDMAKLQFGNSFCQIEGAYVPVADMKLAPEDSVYFTHHVLLWKDPQVNVTTMSMKGGWKRLFAGLPLIMTEAQGPGHIAFSKDDPGELIPVPLQAGEAIDVREHMFLVATGNVQYDFFNTGIWFTTQNGDDSETHYPIGMLMDRFSAPTAPGLLLLHAGGNIFVRELRAGEAILVKPKALVFKDPGVQMQLHFEHPDAGIFGMWGSWGGRYLWLLLYGPGRVAIQSVFEPVEGEGGRITNSSYATRQQW